MDTASVVRGVAVARMVVAGGCLVAPGPAARLWAGDAGRSPDVSAIVRSFAIRDFALGLGVVLADRRGRPVRGWVEAGLLSDATDLVVAALSRGTPLRRAVVAAGVAPFVAGGVASIRALGRTP